jgi:hypothetical protein
VCRALLMCVVTLWLSVIMSGCTGGTVVHGEINTHIVIREDGKWSLEWGIEHGDSMYLLNFADNAHFDEALKSLPYPKSEGFYRIPDDERTSSLMLDNGDIVYFRGGVQYEVVGTFTDFEKVGFTPVSDTQVYVLLTVKRVGILGD